MRNPVVKNRRRLSWTQPSDADKVETETICLPFDHLGEARANRIRYGNHLSFTAHLAYRSASFADGTAL
jgi:hypothetical protein